MVQRKRLTKATTLIILLGFSTQIFSQKNKTNMGNNAIEKIGLLLTMKAKVGKELDVRDFLLGGLPLVQKESGTRSWYAFQVDDRTFGIFDTFDTEEGRQAHLTGEVAKALLASANDLLEGFDVKDIHSTDILASKLSRGVENKGLLVIMKAKDGKATEVEKFLKAGKSLVDREPKTVSWFGIRIAEDTYAIFDTFVEDTGREEHLNGKVAAALMENASEILEGFTTQAIQQIDILAYK